MGDNTLSLPSDFLDSVDLARIKTPNSLFFTEETNKLKSE